eukprot:7383054-Prymnesium_polylepis.3
MPRDFSGHADGTTASIQSIEKWVMAALRKLGNEKTDIILASFEPNDALCSQIHATIADWHTSRTSARDAGVVDERSFILDKPPQQECLRLTRMWLMRHINQVRAGKSISMLSDDWARRLAGVKADARAVNQAAKGRIRGSVPPQARRCSYARGTHDDDVRRLLRRPTRSR